MAEKKDIPINEQFGVPKEEYDKITLEVEHSQVDYRLSAITEKDLILKLFPDVESETQLKILYWGRVQWHAGYNLGKDP